MPTIVDLISPLTVIPAALTITVNGLEITLTYDRRAISGRWFVLAAERPRRALAEALLNWDVTTREGQAYAPPDLADPQWRQADDAGDDVPRTRYADAWETLLEPIPIEHVIQPIVEAIADDWRAGPKAGRGSRAGS